MDDFRWGQASERAALLVAEGDLSYPAIADRLGVARMTLWRWRQAPEFRARVAEHLAEIREDVRRCGVADRHRRVAAYNARWSKLNGVIEARAKDPAMQGVPGGATGLLVRKVRRLAVEADGDDRKRTREVEEFVVDGVLLRELRELEKQAAQDLGQWAERREVARSDGGPPRISIVEVVRPDGVGPREPPTDAAEAREQIHAVG
jgi:hypothetical protein